MQKSNPRIVLYGIFTSVFFMAGIAKVAALVGIASIFFPELAALSYDVFVRPHGVWARAPLMLVITPAVAALLGVLVTRYMPYGLGSITVCILGSIAIIKLLRSPIAPAISASFLALTLDVTSWWYPASILIDCCVLAGLAVIYQRFVAVGLLPVQHIATDALDDELERLPAQFAWIPFFAVFLLLVYLVSSLSGIRMIFFPPLVVIAFEMFSHMDICPWAQRPGLLPLICTFVAAVGVVTVAYFGVGVISTILAMLIGAATLRLSRVHAIPALAIGLLPQVMPHADWHFPLAVGIGSTLLIACFLIFKNFTVAKQRVPG